MSNSPIDEFIVLSPSLKMIINEFKKTISDIIWYLHTNHPQGGSCHTMVDWCHPLSVIS
ncbi:MAG: hypothetical protein ACFFB5_19970 [Promethearchaeota archaeon]